jgi:hypothetical protein
MARGSVLGRRTRRGSARNAILLLFAAVAVVSTVASPIAMQWLAGRSVDWARLSNVGQAYGGVSAVLSALAFCGIAVSLAFQWQQVRISQVVASRERHFELVRLTAEHGLRFEGAP